MGHDKIFRNSNLVLLKSNDFVGKKYHNRELTNIRNLGQSVGKKTYKSYAFLDDMCDFLIIHLFSF